MKNSVLLIVMVLCIIFPFSAETKDAYRFFDMDGNRISFDMVLTKISAKDIIFFGELHNDPIGHWLKLEMLKSLHNKGKDLILGAEMLETDNQLIIDEFSRGLINKRRFFSSARLWSNYATDYHPLVEYAVSVKIPVIATNVPRRYATLVFKKGLKSLTGLTKEARALMAPVPIPFNPELASYKSMTKRFKKKGGMHIGGNLVESQALKDATMAHLIVSNMKKGKTFFHINGAYHSDDKEGIVWFVNKYTTAFTIFTITTVRQNNIENLDKKYKGRADIILVVPASMSKTH